MKQTSSFRMTFCCILGLAALGAGGCGGSTKPHGKVVMNGEPYKPAAGQNLQITFTGDGTPSITTVAQVSPDGTFTVPGPTDNGIPPGKYHITVTTMAGGGPAGSSPPAASGGGDPFQGKFSKTDTTPLTCDINSSNQDIVIDVGKGTVTTGR